MRAAASSGVAMVASAIGRRASETGAHPHAGDEEAAGESVACNLLNCHRRPTPRATVESEEFPMPFLALFGFVSNLMRSVVRGGVGETPALRPIPISERQDPRRRR